MKNMKIYITEETKKHFENLISDVGKYKQFCLNKSNKSIIDTNYDNTLDIIDAAKAEQAIDLLEEILSITIILPEEESWDNIDQYLPDNESQIEHALKYKNGVIITQN